MPPRASAPLAVQAVSQLQMLNWQWLQDPLRRKLPGQNIDVVMTELHRFVAIKVVAGDLDNVNDLAATGSVDEAFHLLLLNPSS